MTKSGGWALLAAIALATTPACGKKVDDDKSDESVDNSRGEKKPASVPGVDAEGKVVKIGILIDESGPAAQIGKPFLMGKRLHAAVVNEGGVLPDGWKVELVEKDHAYDPAKARQHYDAIKNDVLFIGTSFGTPTTRPLMKDLGKDNIIAFPASLSSLMAADEHTPPLGPSYEVEAERAVDWIVAHEAEAGELAKEKIKVAIVYNDDDYGGDAHKGLVAAAERHGVEVAAEIATTPMQKDFTAVAKQLKDSGATHVMLATLPPATPRIIGEATAKFQFQPRAWIGSTPSWVDAFFSPDVAPAALWTNFHWVTGLSYWGEESEGMTEFLAAWEKHGGDMGNPDFYILASYAQSVVQMEALKRAIESDDVSRTGFKKALRSIESFDANGLFQPIDLTEVPYETSTRTRVLAPDLENKTWKVVGDWASPGEGSDATEDQGEDEPAEN